MSDTWWVVAIVALSGWLLALLSAVIKMALDKEYEYWAPRVAKLLITMMSLLLPGSVRGRYRDEWLGELEAVQDSGPLSYAIWVALGAPVMAIRCRRTPRGARREGGRAQGHRRKEVVSVATIASIVVARQFEEPRRRRR